MSKINVSLLKDYRSDFNKEKEKFNSTSFSSFSSSYIKRCSDGYVIRMRDKLQGLYEKVQKGYQNIDSWWIDYNSDVENLEKVLSNDGRSGSIKASSVRNCVNSNFTKLADYTIPFVDVITLNFETSVPDLTFVSSAISSLSGGVLLNTGSVSVDASSNSNDWWNNVTSWWNETTEDIGDWFSEVGADVSEGFQSFGDDVVELKDSFCDWFENDAKPWLTQVYNNYNDINNAVNAEISEAFKSLLATAGTFFIGFGEGILKFGEKLVDFGAIAGTALYQLSSLDTYLAEMLLYGESEYEKECQEMWESTMAFVAKDYITPLFDEIYEKTSLQENAWFFEQVRSVGNGMGEVAGNVSLAFLTGGSSVLFSGAAGFGGRAEEAWSGGASLEEGLLAASVQGIWDSFQWWAGSKINNMSFFQGDKVPVKFLNSLIRIGADTLDSAAEGGVQPLIEMIYADSYFDDYGNEIMFTDDDGFLKKYAEMFDDAGGWTNVGVQAVIGGGSSLIGEIFDLGKYFKDKKISSQLPETIVVEIDPNVTGKLMSVAALLEIITNKDKLQKFLDFDNNTDLFSGFSQQEYIVGIKQLLEAADKNNIDLGLNKAQLMQATNLVNDLFEQNNITDNINIKASSQLPETICVEVDPNATGKLMSVAVLLEIITNEDKLQKFLDFDNNADLFSGGSQQEYIVGIKQLLEAADKNNIDLGLNEVQLTQAINLVNNSLGVKKIVDTVKIEAPLRNMTNFCEQNLLKYQHQIEDFATRLGITYEEAVVALNKKLKQLIDISEFGIRTSNDVLDLILDDGRFKNQFETNTSKGLHDPVLRTDIEEHIINVPKNTLSQDRPVYGMAFPQLSSEIKSSSNVFVTLSDDIKNYYVGGPGDWYGGFRNGNICIFKKDSVINNVSFTLGDSLDYQNYLVASSASSPQFCGSFSGMLDMINSLDELDNIKLNDLMPNRDRYLELQYHGVRTHSIDNLEMIIFQSIPSTEILSKLKAKGIKYKIIN